MTSTLLLLPLVWYALFNLVNAFYKFNIKASTLVLCNVFLLFLMLASNSFYVWESFTTEFSLLFLLQSPNTLLTSLDLGLAYDFSTVNFGFSYLVILIGCGANLYSLNYFKNEADEKKLVILLNLFILSMLTLVLSGNFFTLFLGWELIGLTSYLLINFWSLKISVLKSALKAFTFNLLSDILLLGSLVCFYLDSGTTNSSHFLSWVVSTYQASPETVIYSYTYLGIILLTLCGSIKSVQIIFHIWLPDSMEAPVPASSLIHSATLVSAGIFLLCKFNILIIMCGLSEFLSLIGAMTACYGGVVASQQTDMKKLLAYSTMSHCGFMWFIVSNGYIYLTLIYLFLHGIFKATTFFCAGSFIRANNSQDMRWMNIGSVTLPLDSILLTLCAGNLAGLPLSIGYIYKKALMSILFNTSSGLLTISLLFIGLLSSIVYFYKITKYCLFSYNKSLNQNLINSLSYKLSLSYSTLSLNHLTSVLIVIFFGTLWVFFFLEIMSLTINLFDNASFEILINDRVSNILMNSNMILFFYGLYVVVVVLLFSNFWKTKSYAAEILLSFYFLILSLLMLRCEVT